MRLPPGPLACLAVVLAAVPTLAQRATVVRTDAAPLLDGVLDEPFWERSEPATGFWDNFPSDSTVTEYQTEIRFAADATNLYVAAKCYAAGSDYVVPSLRRDFRAGGSDNLTFIFDAFGTGRNAIVFGINPYGVNREALIANGGEDAGDDFSEAWDNKWRGEARVFDDYWTCELAIPLRSLRYPAGAGRWRFNAYRFDTQSDSRTTWIRIPRQQSITSLAYMGDLVWEAPPGRAGGVATLIPYASGSAQRDFEGEPHGKTDYGFGLGGDAKVAVTSGLNLDLTFNPDFSQVEVDRQIVNLTRFEIGFPERRQFFLENADLFGSFGFENRANPFFSRRIGLSRDTATGAAVQNTIYYGARLSGQLGDRWRVGLLNMQAAADEGNGLPSYNYTVAAAERRLGARSSLGAILVNKQNFTDFADASGGNLDYNRVVGVDYKLATPDNRWTGKTFLHASQGPTLAPDGEGPASAGGNDVSVTHGLELIYTGRRVSVGYDHSLVPADYRAEVGFVPRRDLFTLSPEVAWRTFVDGPGGLTQREWAAETRFFMDAGLDRLTDNRSGLRHEWQWRNTSVFGLEGRYTMIRLVDDFDPTRSEDAVPLPGGERYEWLSLRVDYRSDRRRVFSYNAELEAGQFFNGYQAGVDAEAIYRVQPYGTLGLNAVYTYVDLPAPYASTGILLLGPRIDATFTKSLFLTAVAQYNDQLDNLNLNVRLQWRYAPVSDLFVVYTDNYDTLGGGTRNRGVVAKVTYWLNL